MRPRICSTKPTFSVQVYIHEFKTWVDVDSVAGEKPQPKYKNRLEANQAARRIGKRLNCCWRVECRQIISQGELQHRYKGVK